MDREDARARSQPKMAEVCGECSRIHRIVWRRNHKKQSDEIFRVAEKRRVARYLGAAGQRRLRRGDLQPRPFRIRLNISTASDQTVHRVTNFRDFCIHLLWSLQLLQSRRASNFKPRPREHTLSIRSFLLGSRTKLKLREQASLLISAPEVR